MAGEVRPFRVLFPQRHIPIILISILQAGKNLRKKQLMTWRTGFPEGFIGG
jgi:hypothetical protein